MTQKNDRKVIYRVYGDAAAYGNYCFSAQRLAEEKKIEGVYEYSSAFTGKDFLYMKGVHLYDVYQDGTFHFFDPEYDVPDVEPEEYVQDRKEIDAWIDEHVSIFQRRDHYRASHIENEDAFLTLCRLGFGPNNEGFGDSLGDGVPGRDGTLRNTVRNFRVEYLGEDEPWLEENEYRERNGLPSVEY